MEYTVALCDDELVFRNQLCSALSSYEKAHPGLQLKILVYEDAEHLVKDYPKNLDILLLDISMNGHGNLDGMQAARLIRSFDSNVCIIFITTMAQYALEGYKVRAFGFIRKPTNSVELEHELDSALKAIGREQKKAGTLSFTSPGTTTQIPLPSILYLEVRNHTILVRHDGRTSEFRGQMKDLEEELLDKGFLRCHASYLVNISAIRHVDTDSILLSDGSTIPVSQRKRKAFMDSLASYLGGVD